jgi:hypothetical protein
MAKIKDGTTPATRLRLIQNSIKKFEKEISDAETKRIRDLSKNIHVGGGKLEKY